MEHLTWDLTHGLMLSSYIGGGLDGSTQPGTSDRTGRYLPTQGVGLDEITQPRTPGT